jgi:hypothetical protein
MTPYLRSKRSRPESACVNGMRGLGDGVATPTQQNATAHRHALTAPSPLQPLRTHAARAAHAATYSYSSSPSGSSSRCNRLARPSRTIRSSSSVLMNSRSSKRVGARCVLHALHRSAQPLIDPRDQGLGSSDITARSGIHEKPDRPVDLLRLVGERLSHDSTRAEPLQHEDSPTSTSSTGSIRRGCPLAALPSLVRATAPRPTALAALRGSSRSPAQPGTERFDSEISPSRAAFVITRRCLFRYFASALLPGRSQDDSNRTRSDRGTPRNTSVQGGWRTGLEPATTGTTTRRSPCTEQANRSAFTERSTDRRIGGWTWRPSGS